MGLKGGSSSDGRKSSEFLRTSFKEMNKDIDRGVFTVFITLFQVFKK